MTDADDPRHEEELRAELRAALEREGEGAPDEPPATPPPTAQDWPADVAEPAAPVVVEDDPAGVDEPAAPAFVVDDDPPGVDDSQALPYASSDDEEAAEADADADEGRRRGSLQSTLEWVAVVVGALVVALVVKTFLFQAFYIPSASMEPTLEKGDRVLVNKVSYDLHDVHRGDVIVFELDEEDVGPDGIKDLIKRVIGLPGDVIETREGIVYVNDHALKEPYLAEGMITGDPNDSRNPTIERQTVPDDHVFVLGDNRSNSADSRYPYRGPIPVESIVGRAFVLVWPPGDIGTL